MMKRMLSLLLTAVMLLAFIPSVFAVDYVLPDAIKNNSDIMESLYQFGGWPMSAGGYANLWYVYEGKADGADWPQEYLDLFEEAIAAAELGGEHILYGYEWHGNTLSVDFGAVFDVKYYWSVGISYTVLYGPTADEYTNGLALAVTNNDGNLIRVISDDGPDFVPELKYDEYNAWENDNCLFLSLERATAFEERIGMEKEYTSECRQTVSITLPDDFDPELHNITLYFEDHTNEMAWMEDAPRFSTPYEIEYEHDYFLTYPEVGGKLDFDYTLAEAAPDEVCDYFEELIAADTPDPEYEYMNLSDFYLVDDTFTFSAETGGSIYGYYVPEWTSSGEHIHIKDYHLMAAVRDKASGEILSVENWGRHIRSIEEFADKKLPLPEFYDYDKHEVIFFRYALDFYPDRDYTTPAAVPEVYVSWVTAVDAQDYIFGDANKDHKVSLADVSIMLKYLARWESVGIEVSPYIRDVDVRNCFYNMPDVALVLRMIAGYNGVTTDRYNLVCTSAAKYYYK